jgi:hypothetical protein
MYHGKKKDDDPPFFVSLGMSSLWINNCMLDYGASENVIPLKVMKQFSLKVTRPYKNVCDIDLKTIKVYGIIKCIEVYLIAYPHINIKMNVIVIDVKNALRILFSIKWDATLGSIDKS